jgi:hypothetical protein
MAFWNTTSTTSSRLALWTLCVVLPHSYTNCCLLRGLWLRDKLGLKTSTMLRVGSAWKGAPFPSPTSTAWVSDIPAWLYPHDLQCLLPNLYLITPYSPPRPTVVMPPLQSSSCSFRPNNSAPTLASSPMLYSPNDTLPHVMAIYTHTSSSAPWGQRLPCTFLFPPQYPPSTDSYTKVVFEIHLWNIIAAIVE